MRRLLAALLLVALGAAAGWSARELVQRRRSPAGLVERRSGALRYVNPLLACDLAGDAEEDRGELRPFKEEVRTFLASRLGARGDATVAVYFRELNDGLGFTLGETERFVPASLRKLPMMVALLKMAEQRPDLKLLDRTLTADLSSDYNARQNVQPSETLTPGKAYTVLELIRRMIVYSDNNAFMLLGRVVSPAQLDEVYATIDPHPVDGLADTPFHPVENYASLYRILFSATYLGKEASSWALALLTTTEFRSGIVAGVPPSVEVAHKFGEHSEPGAATVQLHDCGIVYYPQHPYVLCVMSRGPAFEILDDVIAGVSKLVFAQVDAQHATH